jgi:hypothetical protein
MSFSNEKLGKNQTISPIVSLIVALILISVVRLRGKTCAFIEAFFAKNTIRRKNDTFAK